GILEILAFLRRHPANAMNSTQFVRHQVRAFNIALARWGDDPEVVRGVRNQFKKIYPILAWAESRDGNYRAAASAYWRCARLGHSPLGSLARAAWFALRGHDEPGKVDQKA